LRVLLVTEAAGGGVGRHFLDLATGLAERGVAVQGIYSPGRMDASFRERLAAGGLPPLRELSMRRGISPLDAVAVGRLVRLARRLGPFDIVHGHSSKGGAIARLAARWLRLPAVYTPHAFVTLDPTLPKWKRRTYGHIEHWLAHHSAAIVAVSPDEARHARELGIDASKLHVVTNGIGPPAFLPRDEARRRMGLSPQTVAVGFVGRLSEQKAPDHLLRAFADATAALQHARLVMIGRGPLEANLRQLAKELGVAERVRWLGDVPAAPLLGGCDLFCLSSRYEGMPYVLLEALSAGLPIVATDVGGARLVVEQDTNGLVVPINDARALAAALRRLIGSHELRASLANGAAERARAFTLERMVEETVAVYHRAAATASRAQRA
jgi:glycosyltransferase involved in cell wall biosynthesis